METLLQRIQSDKLFISTTKGVYYVDLNRIKNVDKAQSLGTLYPKTFVSVINQDNNITNIQTLDLVEAETVFKYIISQWSDYLLHEGVFENSSEHPRTRFIQDLEIMVYWGPHTLHIDLRKFNAISLFWQTLVISGSGGTFKLTSQNQSFLENLKESLELYIQRKGK